jgi:DNA-binding FadR family transcriptional regulator
VRGRLVEQHRQQVHGARAIATRCCWPPEHLVIVDALQMNDVDAVRNAVASHVENLIAFARRHVHPGD